MESNPNNVPYIVFESVSARHERILKRLWIALLTAIILLFLSNSAWLYAWMQYDYTGETTETTYTQDGHGVNLIGASVIGDGNNVTDTTSTDKNPNAHP